MIDSEFLHARTTRLAAPDTDRPLANGTTIAPRGRVGACHDDPRRRAHR
jgi:hypothetical protein